MNNVWGICCPGPSLNLRATQHQIHNIDRCDYLVALNCAIFNDSRLDFDYWVMSDIEVFEACYQRLHQLMPGKELKNTILWTPARWLDDIPRDYDPLKSFFNQFMKEPHYYCSSTSFPVFIPHIQSWWNYSLFIAIAQAISRGARVINVYGADLCGTEYFKPGFRNGRTRHNTERWTEETAIFNIIKYECKKQDICIVRR